MYFEPDNLRLTKAENGWMLNYQWMCSMQAFRIIFFDDVNELFLCMSETWSFEWCHPGQPLLEF